MKKIASIRIHPALGVMRVGNSPAEFFVGPEKPGDHRRPAGGYRDAQGRIKRQAARFRLFGYDKNGKLVAEITAKEANITWTVHLANKKAEWVAFQGPRSATNDTRRRNPAVLDRGTLIIDPGARSLTGRNQRAAFDTGKFLGVTVPLGEMRTDHRGHLLVLGGFGRSSSPLGQPITEGEFANNDGWHDDVSDGPVNATVELKADGTMHEAAGSWIICGPPKFAPPFHHVVTLYDVLRQVAVDELGLALPAKPSFAHDIRPLLQRAMMMRYVSGMVMHPPADHMHGDEAGDGHDGDGHDGDEHEHGDDDHMHEDDGHDDGEDAHHDEDLDHETIEPAHATLFAALGAPAAASERAAIFERLRDPALAPDADSGESDMPMVHSDVYPLATNQPLTRIQYDMMKKWVEGKFIHDAPDAGASQRITPAGLDQAALESCVGGPFFPGMEAGWLLRDVYGYVEPFRLDQAPLKAGDVTKQMAVPWQADYADCKQEGDLAWWPAQRPDDVFPEGGGEQVPWTRGVIGKTHPMADMVRFWHKLGFIVRKGSAYVETERKAP